MKTFMFYIITTLFFGVIVAAATGEFALSIICSAIMMGVIFLILGNVYKKGKAEREKEQKEFEEKLTEFQTKHQSEYEEYSNKYNATLEKYKSSDYYDNDITSHYSIFDNKLHILSFKKDLESIVKFSDELIPSIENEEKIYDLDNVKYYKIEGSVREQQYISGGGGGGSSMSGALIGGIVGGSAGAIIGSRKENNDITTKYIQTDTRELAITFKDGTKIFLRHKFYEWFLDTIPEKDYDNYIENKKAKGRN